ncbi:MAG: 2-dehydropantoate 2-reductase, partial [Cellvibrionales bacterium]|nr:2-dehydropantoate 2-reductase [Cellvibrionales bacterium]
MKSQTVGKIGLVGPGAVGGYYGGLLALSGQDIHFHFRSSYDSVQENGLWLIHHGEGGRREPVDGLHAHASTESIGVCDWVIVASKATANSTLPDLIRPLVGDHTRLLTLQNGMGNAENMADAFGHDRTILAGLCFTCINRTSPHVIESLLPGYVQFGELGQTISEEGRSIVNAFQSAGVRVRESESLDEALWRKLCWNIPFNGLAIAGGGITTDLILANPILTQRARDLMLEVQAGAKAYHIEIEDSFLDRQ